MTHVFQRPWDSQPTEQVGADQGGIAVGLVAYGRGDDDREWEPINSPTTTVSAAGRQKQFVAGSSQYLKRNLAISGPLTLFALYVPTAAGTNRALLSVGASTNDRHLLYRGSTGPVMMFSGSGGTTGQASGVSGITTGAYTSVVGRVSAANSRQIFLNGRLDGTNSTSVSPAESNTAAVGAYWTSGAPTAGFYCDGSILIWGIWNRALSDSEINALYVNPWQLFEPRRILIPMAAAAGGAFKSAWALRNSRTIGAGVI